MWKLFLLPTPLSITLLVQIVRDHIWCLLFTALLFTFEKEILKLCTLFEQGRREATPWTKKKLPHLAFSFVSATSNAPHSLHFCRGPIASSALSESFHPISKPEKKQWNSHEIRFLLENCPLNLLTWSNLPLEITPRNSQPFLMICVGRTLLTVSTSPRPSRVTSFESSGSSLGSYR